MRSLIFLLLLLCTGIYDARAQRIQASVDVYKFQAQGNAYAEVFFYVLGDTALDSIGSKSVEILYFFIDSTGEAVGDKYNLVASHESGADDFMDLRRHYLDPGKYLFSATITDRNAENSSVSFREEVEITATSDSLSMSDVQLLVSATPTSVRDTWYKQGNRCIPMPFNFCHEDMSDMVVYTELYNSDQVLTEDFFVKFSVVAELDDLEEPVLKSHKRLSPAPVVPVMVGIEADALCSGRYFLIAEIFNRNKELLKMSRVEFVRSNPIADSIFINNFEVHYETSFAHKIEDDSLEYVLRSLAPKVSQLEVQVLNDLVRRGEPDAQRRFIHRYWAEESPSNPELAYIEYMQVARRVDELFHSGNGHGFETDRGMVFMKYGAPDDQIAVEDEPSAPPYEIWIYYNFPVTGQSNVKFLFYDPSLTNEFLQLHSTAIGEFQNVRWEQMLYSRAVTETESGDLIDAVPVADNFHRNARRYFTDY